MNAEPDSVLSNSLRSIDAARRMAIATVVLSWVTSLAALCSFVYILHTSHDLERALAAAVGALGTMIFVAAFAVMVYVARMTRRILRAIEVAITRGPSES